MKQLTKINLFFALLVLLAFSSCSKNEITNLSLSKSSIALNVGQSDSLVATITLSGEIAAQNVSFTHSTPGIVSITESEKQGFSQTNDGNAVTKSIIFKALKTGTTTITLKSGDKTAICEITVNPSNYNFARASSANWGDFYDTETNSFDLYLFEGTLAIMEGKLTGNGTYLYFDLSIPLSLEQLMEGTYSASNEAGKINTFFPGDKNETQVYGSRLTTINGKDTTITLVNDGQFSITRDGNNYIIKGDLITESNSSIQFSYNGVLPMNDLRDPIDIKPVFTKGELLYLGDAYTTKFSHNFIVYLANKSVDFESTQLKLGDQLLMLELNTALTVTDSIPSGSYNMLTKMTVASDLVPFSLVFGYTNDKDQNWGCWYYGETTNKLKTGNVTVKKSGTNYTINYSLFDRFGSKVSGNFTGPLTYIDKTKTAATTVSAARIKSFYQTKSISKIPLKEKKIKSFRIN